MIRRALAWLGIRTPLDAICMLAFTAALIAFGIYVLNSI